TVRQALQDIVRQTGSAAACTQALVAKIGGEGLVSAQTRFWHAQGVRTPEALFRKLDQKFQPLLEKLREKADEGHAPPQEIVNTRMNPETMGRIHYSRGLYAAMVADGKTGTILKAFNARSQRVMA